MKKIPSIGPWITQKEIDLVTEAVAYGWYENMNMHIDQFVQEFSAYTGMKYCLPASHGTDAIHLALLGLEIGPGDEVIVPDITWVGSASPIVYAGATPVFVDIDEKDWCISPAAFERAINEKTKAVVVVDLFGNMPDMEKIIRIAKRNNVYVIEDAAEAIGAEYDLRPAGSFGDVGIFSFNATKLVITGQGGMVCTNSEDVYDRCRLFSHHGIDKKTPGGRYYWSTEIGYNYNWSNIQAALCLAQLRRINELVEKKRLIFSWYDKRLKDVTGLQLNFEAAKVKNTYWITVAILSEEFGMEKELVQKEFERFNIDARPFFYPISSMPPYARYCHAKDVKKLNPVSYGISPFGICLPSGMLLEEDDVDYVCGCFKKILN